MEPIGFAASLITVVGLVTTSSKKIHELRAKLRNAPKDVENLLEQVQTFENLLHELEMQLQDHRNSVPPQETLQRLSHCSRKSRRVRRFCCWPVIYLARKRLERYRRKIDIHCGTLTNIQALVCSRKLGKVSESITQLGEEDRAGFQTLTSELSKTASRLNSEAKASFSTISSLQTITESANEARHQTVLAHLDDHAKRDDVVSEKIDEVFERHVRSMDMNEAGFQAVRSSLVAASSSSKEDHKKTHAMLSQFQGQWQQVLRDHVTFEAVGSGVRSSTRGARASSSIAEITAFWEHSFFRTPIGMLHVRMNKIRQSKDSSRLNPRVCTTSDIVIEFVPPRWLSSVVLNYSMKLNYDLISHQWRLGATLKPLTVNYNPFFINAVQRLDVEGVRRSFAEGLARPTDCIIYFGHPCHWSESLGMVAIHTHHKRTRLPLMMDLMTTNGFSGQEFLMRQLTYHLSLGRKEDQVLFRNQVQKYSKSGGKVLGADPFVFHMVLMSHTVGRIDWIADFLLNAKEPWLVDDMSSLQLCLIATLAHVDAVFSDRLRKELASYRSPASAGQPSFGDYLFESTFGAASIGRHFCKLEPDEAQSLIAILCRTGSTTMLQPFMDIGVEVNKGYSCHGYNMLGLAAAEGNMDIVYMLLENGANSHFAISTFLSLSKYSSDTFFRRLIKLLVEKARPALFAKNHDPLLAIIKSYRAQCSYPEAAEILLDRKVVAKDGFGGGASKVDFSYSYMFNAILSRSSSMVDLLLQNGVCADARISQSFDCHGNWFGECTWTTFSVACSTASCTNVLIQHRGDVTALDGAGRSALQLARNHTLGSHPRETEWYYFGEGRCRATAKEDAETLDVVERAFKFKFQGTKNLDDFLDLSNEVAPQPPSRRNRLMSLLQKLLGKALGTVLTPSQTELLHLHLRYFKYDIQKIWSLSFPEALLMRCFYVISYALLLAYELNALIKGGKRIPMPSRFLLSALAFLALAVIWGASQEAFSWGSLTAGAKA